MAVLEADGKDPVNRGVGNVNDERLKLWKLWKPLRELTLKQELVT